MLTTRRALLALTGASLAASPRPAWAQNLSRGVFTHGVASGDPLPDGVIIWTRFIGPGGRIGWEVSEDESFAQVMQRGEASASPVNDFCVKIDVRGLLPGRRYFYRFLSASDPSPTGHTRTAPAQGGDSLSIALFSCSNYGFGYFHAYGHAAMRDDIDLAVHTGDYIYEYGRTTYPNEAETVAGRIIDPATEIVRLNDYYQRYAIYHGDPDLQALRQAKPMAVIWDDHEITNDTWRDGAQNHQVEFEGTWIDRVAAASKAYFDWMPIRRPTERGARIYRTLDWGDLARIVLLDTRHIGRDEQINYRTELMPRLAESGTDAAAAVEEFRRAVLDNPSRTLLGADQERWFAEALAQSKSRGQTWQIIAQQVIMGEQMYAQGAIRLLPESASAGTRQWIAGGEQIASLGLPWNMDSWGGYPAARARLLEACVANANNTVVLAGDSHNCWLNNIAAPAGSRNAAIEFAGGSVTSPGFERSLSNAQSGEREALMRNANPNLAWCDLTKRGYGALRFTRTACEAEWVAFADVRVPDAGAPEITRLVAEASEDAGPSGWVAPQVDSREPRRP